VRRSTLAAIGAALAVAACGSSAPPKTQTLPASGAPPRGRVPVQSAVLTVTRGRSGRKPSLSVSTTPAELGKLATIAAMLDQLHPVGKGVLSCPNIPVAPTVTFTFRARRRGPALARATMPATGPRGACPGIEFRAQGRPAQALYAHPAFLRDAGSVLGVPLLSK
jgi:hypothetical protein